MFTLIRELREFVFDDMELIEALGYYGDSKLLVRFNLSRIRKYSIKSFAIPVLVWENITGRRITEFVSRLGSCHCKGDLIKRDNEHLECVCCYRRVRICIVCGEQNAGRKCKGCGYECPTL